MYCFIKEWPNKMATLMTADGVVLCTLSSTDEAQQVWHSWYRQQKDQAESFTRINTAAGIRTDQATPEIIPCTSVSFRWSRLIRNIRAAQ